MSIKTSTSEWVRKGPAQAIAVIAAVGLLIGVVLGFGLGYKVEQSRTNKDVTRLRQQLKTARASGPAKTVGISQRVGKVTVETAASITVLTKLSLSQVLVTSASTEFEKAVKGALTDVKVGSRVLVVPGGGEILVLEAGSKLGRVVSTVTKASILVKAGNGAPAGTVKTSAVKTVSTLKSATRADVTRGTQVLAGGRQATGNKFDTIEIIVLRRGTGFAR